MVQAVFVDCTPELRKVIDRRGLVVPQSVRIFEGRPDPAQLIERARTADVIFIEHTAVPPSVLDACPSIKAIVFMGTGVGTYVDLDDAAKRGVAIRITPGYGDRAVAEHALALMFAAARRIVHLDQSVRQGNWQPVGGIQLHGLKLAVVGLGGIGACLADMAGALGMKVAGWNRTAKSHPAYVADLDDALHDADIVSLHLLLNDQTRGLIDVRRLALPKPGFILVNTARADLVDEAALLAALDHGQIGHAALDVFPKEPLASGNPYVGRANVTLTPHAAYMTEAAYVELWRRTLSAYDDLARDLGTPV